MYLIWLLLRSSNLFMFIFLFIYVHLFQLPSVPLVNDCITVLTKSNDFMITK